MPAPKNAKPAGQGNEGQSSNPAGSGDEQQNGNSAQNTGQGDAASTGVGQTMTGTSTGAGKKSTNGGTTRCLIVSAKSDGFRRAGRVWTRKHKVEPLENFSPEQIEQIATDPELVYTVQDLTDEQIDAALADE